MLEPSEHELFKQSESGFEASGRPASLEFALSPLGVSGVLVDVEARLHGGSGKGLRRMKAASTIVGVIAVASVSGR